MSPRSLYKFDNGSCKTDVNLHIVVDSIVCVYVVYLG